jgi:hypothetical protein
MLRSLLIASAFLIAGAAFADETEIEQAQETDGTQRDVVIIVIGILE